MKILFVFALLASACATPSISSWDPVGKTGSVSVDLSVIGSPTPDQFKEALRKMHLVCPGKLYVYREGTDSSRTEDLGYYGKYLNGAPYYSWYFVCGERPVAAATVTNKRLLWDDRYDNVQLPSAGANKYLPGAIIQFEKLADEDDTTDWIESRTSDTEEVYRSLIDYSRKYHSGVWISYLLQGKHLRYRVIEISKIKEAE